MIGMTIKAAIKATMKNHTYKFKNKILQQSRKGIMGIDLMRALAKLYMIDWTAKFKDRLAEIQENSSEDLKLNLNLEAYKIYVDDQSSLQEATPKGATYDPKKKVIIITEEQFDKDKELKADRRTANLMTKIANSIDPSIVMEAAVPSDFPEKKLPLLNCKVWMENTEEGQQIRYEHFEKPCASILEIQKDSAMPGKNRRATLVQ